MSASPRRKFLILPPVVLGAAVLAYQVAFKAPPEQNPPQERVRHVRVIEAAAIGVVPRVVGYGSVEPARVWNAVPQVAGRIVHVHPDFKKGAILEAGTEIVRIAATDYEIAIKQANANIRAAEAKLEEFTVSEQNTRDSLAIEKTLLGIAEQELARVRKLLRQGTVAQALVDQEERDWLTQKVKVQNLENTLRLLPTQRAAQDEQIAVYRAQLETAELNLERTSIRMPFEGRVAKANVEVTQYVGVGTDLGSADGMDAAEVEAQVPQSRFLSLVEVVAGGEAAPGVTGTTVTDFAKRFGLHAVIRLRFDNRYVEWQGRVVRISDTIDPKTRTVGAIVVVDKPYAKAVPGRHPPLVKGMFVEVELRTSRLQGKIVVPRTAVHAGRLYIADDKNRLDIRTVETSLVQGNLALVSQGLTAGEKVVVSDLSPAISGMALETTLDTDLARRIAAEAGADEVPP